MWNSRRALPSGEYNLRLQLAELVLELGELGVGVLDDGRDMAKRSPVFGHLPQLFGTLLDLELLADLPAHRLLQFLQLAREQGVGEVAGLLQPVLVGQLVQDRVADVVTL